MMRYYFDLDECGMVTRDPEGREFDGLPEARLAAVRDARALMCAELTEGVLCMACHIDIRTKDEAVLCTVAFRDAVRVTGLD